jgi:pimeloyl-ACP methyl ester carboxylesterase
MKYFFFCSILIVISCQTSVKNMQNTPTFAPNSIAAILQYPFAIKTVTLNDTLSIAYQEAGKKGETPLLFIHGLGSYMRGWDKNFDVLSASRPCFRIDLLGYGKSSKADYESGMAFYAHSIKQFCDKLKLKKVILVGHSMGGQISITTALLYPELVEKLILIDPAGFETFNEASKQAMKNVTTAALIQTTPDDRIRQNFAINFHKGLPDDAQFMVNDRFSMKHSPEFATYCQIVARNVHQMLNEPVFPKLKNIQQATLVFFGEKEALIPNRYLNPSLNTEGVAQTATKEIPKAELVMLPDAGHFAMWEQADLVNQKILLFLQKN